MNTPRCLCLFIQHSEDLDQVLLILVSTDDDSNTNVCGKMCKTENKIIYLLRTLHASSRRSIPLYSREQKWHTMDAIGIKIGPKRGNLFYRQNVNESSDSYRRFY